MMSDEYIRKERVIEEINNLREHIPESNYGLWQDGYACGLSDAYSAISNIIGLYRTDVASREFIPSATFVGDVPPEDWFKERFAEALGKFALENNLMTFETIRDSDFETLGSVMSMRATFLTESEPEEDDNNV